ncbi:hypothetical protein J4481_00140 [Candidatus Pacearchaeota archaeon]|nr:hypothetical protein [Candidatus Pacearchaeota archaeon]
MEESNPIRKLVIYFKKNLEKGYTEESLKVALMNQGYSRTMIERAAEQLHQDLARTAPILKDKPIIKHYIIDENDQPITIKKPFWKKVFG